MFRRQDKPGTPPLMCADCDSPVVKTTDGQFVCVGCDRAYQRGGEQWTQRNHHSLIGDA